MVFFTAENAESRREKKKTGSILFCVSLRGLCGEIVYILSAFYFPRLKPGAIHHEGIL
jgi:hypothetical protein